MTDSTPSSPADRLPAWQQLRDARAQFDDTHMRTLFAEDPQRFQRFSLEHAGIFLDYSKHLIDEHIFSLLVTLAEQAKLPKAIEAMFSGLSINTSENRPVLHIALRRPADSDPITVQGKNIMPEISRTLDRLERFTWAVRNAYHRGYSGKPIRDIVNIGIGGSFLGPQVAAEALKPYAAKDLRCHWVANIDGSDIAETLSKISPDSALFIISSKSFTTQETRINADAARTWFLQNGGSPDNIGKHFVAVSNNLEGARAFGIAEEHVFPMWDWVGGRFSLWSAIGLPVALSIGMENFRQLLDGAWKLDEHFRTAPLNENLPVIMALLGIWYSNFFGAASQAVIPYDRYLGGLPTHLQQLDMESNGKRVTLDGQPVDYVTGPIIWGGPGSNGQHAYHQLIHQGSRLIPVDFILPRHSHNPIGTQHALLAANCLSQSQAMMQGKTQAEVEAELLAEGLSPSQAKTLAPHKVIPGNKPSNTLLVEKITPASVGALIALYEHKVFVQGAIWQINSFDQWGVELGKKLTGPISARLTGQPADGELDPSTEGLITRFLGG